MLVMVFCVGLYFANQSSLSKDRSIASKTRDRFSYRRLPNHSPCVYNFNCESNFCDEKKCVKRPYGAPDGDVGDACYGKNENCLSDFCYSGFCLGSDKFKARLGQLCIANSECESGYCADYVCARKLHY